MEGVVAAKLKELEDRLEDVETWVAKHLELHAQAAPAPAEPPAAETPAPEA
jgi:hypothetical protein